MGTHKQELLAKAKTAKGSARAERTAEHRKKYVEAFWAFFKEHSPNIAEYIDEPEFDIVDFRYYRKRDYSYLALLKVDVGGSLYVAFGTGDDLPEALYGLDRRVGKRGLTEETPYEDRKSK